MIHVWTATFWLPSSASASRTAVDEGAVEAAACPHALAAAFWKARNVAPLGQAAPKRTRQPLPALAAQRSALQAALSIAATKTSSWALQASARLPKPAATASISATHPF